MGWHASLVSIENITVQQFLEQHPEFHLTEHQYKDGYEATSSSMPTQFAIGQVGTWLLISDSVCSFFETRSLASPISRGRRVFIIVMEGASGSHGFQLYVDEVLKRSFLFIGAADNPVVYDEGETLPEEDGTNLLDAIYEENMFDIWERITGLSFQTLERTTFQGLISDKFDEYL